MSKDSEKIKQEEGEELVLSTNDDDTEEKEENAPNLEMNDDSQENHPSKEMEKVPESEKSKGKKHMNICGYCDSTDSFKIADETFCGDCGYPSLPDYEKLEIKTEQKESAKKVNETTPENKNMAKDQNDINKKADKREGASKDIKENQSAKRLKFVDEKEDCTNKSCKKKIEELQQQREDDLNQIYKLDKALNEKGLVRRINILEDEIEVHAKATKMKDNTIARQKAQIIELKAEKQEEKDQRIKAQVQRETLFKQMAKEIKTKQKQEPVTMITSSEPEYKFMKKLINKCKEKRIRSPESYYIQSSEGDDKFDRMIGIIEKKKKLDKFHKCLLCDRRFYPKHEDTIKMEPSFGVMMVMKEDAVPSTGPMEAAHFEEGSKGMKKVEFAEEIN